MKSLKLTNSELRCLRAVVDSRRAHASAISTAIHVARPYVSRVISSLEAKGFVTAKKLGLTKTVTLSDAKHAELWRKLVLEYGHMSLDELISGVGLEVLAALCYGKLHGRREIAEQTSVSESSVAKVLERLKQVGIVQKRDGTYFISPRFKALQDFVIEFRHYLNEKTALEFANDAIVLWEWNADFIIESKRPEGGQGFQLTGVSLFPLFGIELLAPTSHFFYSPFTRKLKLEDAILHSLLIPNKTMLPILLAWKENERKLNLHYLEEKAERYGAESLVTGMVGYFETHGSQRPMGFPAWDEFIVRAKEYGLA